MIKSKSINAKKIDLIIEIKCKDEDKLMFSMLKTKDIENINLLQHDGEKRL